MWFMFFPELPLSALLVAASPFWAVSLMLGGQVGWGIVILATVPAMGYAAYRSARANQRWATYFCIAVILGIALVVESNSR
jgi:hypothetical protein